jgi:hypothetical protein
MAKRNSKIEIGDVVYIPRMPGGIPIIDEETIISSFKIDNDIYFETTRTGLINENAVFKTNKQALKKLKNDVKNIINQMKFEIKNIEEEIKLENNEK